MTEFIYINGLPILVLAAFFLYTGILIYQKKWTTLKCIAYRLIMEAEQAITGSKQGEKRFELVFSRLYGLIPAWLRIFLPEEFVKEKLQDWFDEIKEFLCTPNKLTGM